LNVTDENNFDQQKSYMPKIDTSLQSIIYNYVMTHFLPANYPASVKQGYRQFASLSFCASIAGSASMVLSTQTLLLAVGVVGQGTSASIMAGALNWVLKDGIGQLGGVWFISFMGRSTSQFDVNPKYWRMVAAISLDTATLLELISPLVPANWVLLIASIANVGKNIGFLTASASRAVLHQAVAKTGNLGDVTAKAGAQSMAASLIGTSFGIGISPLLGDIPHFISGFMCLSLIHLICNYLSLKAVPLAHFNNSRLDMVLKNFIQKDGMVMSPVDVANKENFLPLPFNINNSNNHQQWLKLGSTVQMLGGPKVLKEILEKNKLTVCKPYILVQQEEIYHLVFTEGATGLQVVQGLYHAYWLHNQSSFSSNYNEYDLEATPKLSDNLVSKLQEKGWDLSLVAVEPKQAIRLRIVDNFNEKN